MRLSLKSCFYIVKNTLRLTESDKEFINHHYLYLNGIPNALAKVFLSFPTWDFSSIIHFYAFLKQTDPLALSESLELLLST